jgi:hypothetical protein
MSDMGNTFVSQPGAGPGGASTYGDQSLPNGQGLPGANMPMTTAVLIPLAVGGVGLAVLYNLFRREGGKLPPLRVDAANALNVWFSWLVIQTPLKLLAYKYHGHKVAQALLLVA